MRERIEKILREDVGPFLTREGGGVELVEVTEDNIVKVRLTGACGGCPLSQMTLRGMVEKTLKSKIPEIKSVEAVP